MNKEKLIHQLFIGKVSDEIGLKRTTELLREAKEAFSTCDSYYANNLSEQKECLNCGKLPNHH